MTKKLRLFAAAFLTLISFSSSAQFSDWNFGLGVMNQTPGRYQTEVGGDKSSMNNRVALETGLVYEVAEDWTVHGDFGLLWPGGAEEDYISKQVYYLNLHGGYALTSDWLLRLGTGLYFTRINGDGGTVSIRNGNGFTDFYVPEQSSISQNLTVNMASEYFFDKDYSLKGEVFLFNPTDSRNRSFNVALTFRYHLGDSLWKN